MTEAGADVGARNGEGKTAAELARDGGHLRVAQFLEARTPRRRSGRWAAPRMG